MKKKSGKSSLVYNSKTKQFSLGGGWKNGNITESNVNSKEIYVIDKGGEWVITILDTKNSKNGAGYEVYKKNQ